MDRAGGVQSHHFLASCAAAWLTLSAARQPAPGQASASPAPPPNGTAQQLSTTAEGALAESVDVSVVSVDVVVRDRSGELLSGLTRNDFTLHEDGRKVEISNFAVAGDTRPATPQRQPSADTSKSITPANADNRAPHERLNLVVYIDNANLHPGDRNRILKQLRAFLDNLVRQDDQVLVVTHDLVGLRVRHPFRESLSALGAELDQIQKEAAGGISTDLASRQAMELIRSLGCKRVDEAASIARAHAESVLAEVGMTYANLHHLLESLGSLDGRKVLVYVGDGVPTQVGTDVFGMIDEMCAQGNSQSMRNVIYATPQLHQVTAAANANGVTLYTLEGAGLVNYASAEHAGHPLLSFELTQRVNADRQDSLTNMATETGGRAALNGNDFTHDLDRIRADLEGGYSLGFMPAHAGDGKVHDLRVDVDRPGARATYRSSYRDRTPEERLEGLLEAALLHGQADNPLAASLKLGAAAPSEHGKVLVPLQLRIPFSKLALIPQEDGRHGRLLLLAGTIDERGSMSRIQRAQIPLRVADADLPKTLASNLGYDLKLLLEPGIQRVAFAVRDEASHATSCLIRSLMIEKSGTVSLRPSE